MDGGTRDGGTRDGKTRDGGTRDGGTRDSGTRDSGTRDSAWEFSLPSERLYLFLYLCLVHSSQNIPVTSPTSFRSCSPLPALCHTQLHAQRLGSISHWNETPCV